MDNKVTIIAEAGVNHNGSLDMALQLVDVAAEAGADYVKFQSFKAELIASASAKKAEYQTQNTGEDGSQLEMLKKLELSENEFAQVAEHCKKRGIKFMCTAFDLQSLDMVVGLGVDALKLPSGEITNAPLLLAHAQKGLSIILSTGMANLEEVQNAVAILAWGYENAGTPTSLQECIEKFTPMALEGKLSVLHCTSQYPAPLESLNLKAIRLLEYELGLPAGYSDHSDGILVPLLAVGAGAKIIEKHFTLDKNMEGPDHKASLEPDELKEMVAQIRVAEQAMGEAKKVCTEQELDTKKVARRGVYASKEISDGEVFSEDNLVILRPEGQTSPADFWSLLGTKADKGYQEGEAI